ncbi:uncharacterized protein NESG_01801 [Nematocida ausubeli]|uniref:Uncharacterized protein n=1 Tax=Nematocida ausubeli (strain ATCC PRA-371 / ERTm2) TaxID=1913371 RepID=A0A086J0Z7_NEMA1|nr:uncharacterized protein NESG_01801 [Nematocida ausubeli]KFG25815.1 hypothetical protein NESG_01801 [Nematocida ausubeli]
MVYYIKRSERIKIRIVSMVCTIYTCIILRVCSASNGYSCFETTEIRDLLANIDKSDLFPAMSKEDYSILLELHDVAFYSENTLSTSENLFPDSESAIQPAQISNPPEHQENLPKLNNEKQENSTSSIFSDSELVSYLFDVENEYIEACRNQKESILNNPVEEITSKRQRESISTSSDDNLSTKKRKSAESIEDMDSCFGRTKVFIETNKYENAYKNLNIYKSQAQSNLKIDEPRVFSYCFVKGGMDNENTKCECSIEKNCKNIPKLWHLLTSSHHNSLAEKIECIKSLANQIKKEQANNPTKNGYYYYFFLEDFKKYIETHIDIAHISAKYDYTDSCKNNICSMSKTEPETLGEIYEETQTDLKWWANSMSVISAKTEEIKSAGSADAALKEKLHLILKLPEVLRDLVLITPEILLKTKREMENHSNLEASRAFCIIEYLYYLVNDDAEKMNIAYNEVKALSVNGEPINDQSTMVVYILIYDAFCLFYQCAPFTCVADIKSEEDNPEKKEARIKSIFHSHCPHIPKSGVFRLRGKRAIVELALSEYNPSKTTNSTRKSVEEIEVPKPTEIEQQDESFLNLSHHHSEDHYHVQLVDNMYHTVKLIPIPYYNSIDGSIQRKTHSIWDIVEYIKSILNSTYPEKDSEFNVYPFKYNRKDRKWAFIDENFKSSIQLELDITLDEMNDNGYDVLFYYFEEDIYTDYFKCIDFQISADSNSETPRIPLFLTNFMLVSAIVSPYAVSSTDSIGNQHILNYANEKNEAINSFQMDKSTAVTSHKPSAISSSDNESQPERSYINYYYSDFLVRNIKDCAFFAAECFSTGILLELSEITGELSTGWYTQIKRSIREYTNYCFSISTAQKLRKKRLLHEKNEVALTLLDILQSESSTDDKVTYGLCIYTSSSGKEVAVPIMCEKMRRLLSENIHSEINSDILPPCIDIEDIKEDTPVFITVKTFNYMQANLGIHYDIIAALFHNNDDSAPAPKPKSSTKAKNKAVGIN